MILTWILNLIFDTNREELNAMFSMKREREREGKGNWKARAKYRKGTFPEVDFINILLEHFSYKSALRSFSLLHFGLVICWQKNIGKRSAC